MIKTWNQDSLRSVGAAGCIVKTIAGPSAATAYYLARNHAVTGIALIDCGHPMAFTSAQSGENYRNWWPHPSMVAFSNRSIDLLERIAIDTENRINMNRRGYALATRRTDIDDLVQQLHDGFGDEADALVRYHDDLAAPRYQRSALPGWQGVPAGIDILRNQDLIRKTFPSYSTDIQTLIHVRRGGAISAQQLGMIMLEYLKENATSRVSGTVKSIRSGSEFTLELLDHGKTTQVTAEKLVNAAGPFANSIAGMLGLSLPIFNIRQQKLAFEDIARTIPRDLPFSINLDEQLIDWQDDERDLLLDDPDYRWLGETMPGAVHCRPDGGDRGSWVKLGWAYNECPAEATWEVPLDDSFPEVVLRGAARLNPSLKAYYGRFPAATHHYGGWYTMTEENWPLIGPMEVEGAYMNCAMSGFGTMAACAAGELCAAWVADGELPAYANEFSQQRYEDDSLLKRLRSCNKGIL